MITDWFAGPSPGMPGWDSALEGLADITVLLASVWAVHAVLGRRRVLVRSGLWNAVLLASIALPALALGLPRMRMACLPAPATMAAAAGPAGLFGGTGPAGDSAPRVGPAAEPVIGPLTGRPAVTRPEAHRPGAIEGAIRPGATLVIGLYVVGAIALSSRLVGSLAMVARLKETAIVIEDPCWTRRLSHWHHRLGMARPVRLLRSAGVRVPMALGWLRPAIILPGGEADPEWVTESHRDAVLLHELAHLRRGDDLWNLLQRLVQILYWPHPLVWMMARTVAEVREQACDDLCVRWLGGAGAYR